MLWDDSNMSLQARQDYCEEEKSEHWSPEVKGKGGTDDYDGHKEKHPLSVTMLIPQMYIWQK